MQSNDFLRSVQACRRGRDPTATGWFTNQSELRFSHIFSACRCSYSSEASLRSSICSFLVLVLRSRHHLSDANLCQRRASRSDKEPVSTLVLSALVRPHDRIVSYLVRIWSYDRIWPAEVSYLTLNNCPADSVARYEVAVYGIVLMRHIQRMVNCFEERN